MNNFRRFFLDGEQCVQVYGLCSPREELRELLWALGHCKRHRCAYGFASRIKAMLKDGIDAHDNGSEEDWEWARDEAFSLFEDIAAARGCVFMLHPDLPGEAFLMTRAWARRGKFID